MIDFGASILDTALSWVDTTQSILPGFRDRVVEVRTGDQEGGLNLKMKPATITMLANRGIDATGLFDEFDLDAHRWIRYRVMMHQLDEVLEGMAANYAGVNGYEELITNHPARSGGYPLGTPRRAAAMKDATTALMNVAHAWDNTQHPSIQGSVPNPRPVLRIVPRQ
jgi:hypothetical protein